MNDPFLEFLHASPTVFHAAHQIEERLKQAGFVRLREEEPWHLEPGKKYFVTRTDTLVVAFRTPEKTLTSSVLLASHIDSPCLKIKPQPETSSHAIGQLGTENYGAPLLHTWLDRDLAIAGRITVQTGPKKSSHIVTLENPLLIIPSLAIHLDKTVTEKGLIVHKQDHLKPIFTLNFKEKQLEMCLHHYKFDKLLSYDLFLVPCEKPAYLGIDKELIAAYRLDNLTSAYAALDAITKASNQSDVLQWAVFWDHEEIGSVSHTGADSPFCNQVLERICLTYKMGREEYYRLKARSICLSGDLAHGFNPNYAEKYDPQNSPYLGKGVVLKFNANQKYATSSLTAALIASLAEKAHIPLQKNASRSDIASGSTVGSIMAANLGMATVDLGIAGWAMHSTRETIATIDETHLCKLFYTALMDPIE